MKHFCRNCLDLDREVFQKTIEEYVQNLSPDDKAGERLYQTRLQICSACSDCLEGLCRVCGCFVMARAAKKKARCPAVLKKW
ncbi:MAG: hypothetical protein GX144_13845 [Clostridiaceae bacterium]|jgi:hypothetical protein|nr:hypothetical protein [Clostridiaceae bacterium]